jgi:hypothetical protein
MALAHGLSGDHADCGNRPRNLHEEPAQPHISAPDGRAGSLVIYSAGARAF